ncbi:MAG: DNA polymerase I, partial [Candidatus Omnitrophica bacterium]|nr:DNA polymerase I [Candidatus Omnitrophota bacterium]
MTSPRAFLIDGTAFCYRAFYAIRNLSTRDGRPTNAVYGFAVMLQALREKERPDYLAVAFDVGKPTFRHEKFEGYKIQRKPMPDSLIGQIPVVKTLLAAYRIPVFEREGYEAEDVLATIARRIAAGGVETFLVTGDKDALQLVNSHIKVYNPHHREDAILDAASVRARYGVGPERTVDLMALMGDEIDNIPGVPGIGEKTATQLIQRFGSLEDLYRHLDEIESPARRKSLEGARQQVELSRELARVRSDVPVDVALKDLAVQAPDWRSLRSLFRELEFKRLLGAIEERSPAAPAPAHATHPVMSEHDLDALASALSLTEGKPVAILCRPLPIRDGIDGGLLALALREEGWVVPVDRETFRSPAGQRLGAWLANADAPKISHDAKAATRILERCGVRLTLSDLSDEYLDQPLGPLPKLEGMSLLEGAETLEPFSRYACAVTRLHERLLADLASRELAALYTDLELPLLGVLAQMEAAGVAIDVPYLNRLRASMRAELTGFTEEIYRLAGGEFNLNSPKQLAQVLFERLQLPVIKRNKTGPSTDSDVLQQLAAHHPLPANLMRYRELSKLVSTYVDALPQLVDPKTGRIHTSFNQTATATGRLSSSEPNLQNIPVKTELGRSIRKAFIPGIPDGLLAAADYSQIELRILAHLSGDEHLIEAFHQGRDI